MIPATLQDLAVPLDTLRPYARNPRRGDVATIVESLRANGQYRPIVVRSSTREVLAGNHTLAAARELGWSEIAATFVDVDDEQAARIVLVDNRANDVAGYDEAELAELLRGLPDLEGTGYDQAALDALVYGLEQAPAQAPDGIDELPDAQPIARLGDVFVLGPHRVVCGDATDPEAVAALMVRERAQAMWTDPPYGVEYVGKTRDALRIVNDGSDGLEQLLTDAWPSALAALEPGSPVYVAHSDTRRVTFETTLTGAGFLIRQNLIWVKDVLVLGHSDYQYRHEPILAAEVPSHEPVLYGFAGAKPGRLGRGGPWWFGPNSATTVFEVPKPPRNAVHPTMKPVQLICDMLANSVRPGWRVLDLFGGSGSTLMACEVHGAAARLVELDPRFVDVICARWQKHTGQLPLRDGVPCDFLEAA
jgi:site-specific DNA-methyltransferase (adenine-specific)